MTTPLPLPLPAEELEFYWPDGDPKKCRVCGCTDFKETVKDFIDFGVPGGGPATEVQYDCASCGEAAAYWAYGSFDPSFYKL